MASKPVMLLGNLASIFLSIFGLLQYVSWTIAGAMILAILSITTLLPTANPIFRSSGNSANKRSAGHPATETRMPRERTLDRPVAKSRQAASRSESRLVTRNDDPRPASQTSTEFQKTIIPKITSLNTIPASASPSKQDPTRPSNHWQGLPNLLPPRIQPSVLSTPQLTPPRNDPNTRIIGIGDYGTYDLQLDRGYEAKCNVSATCPVNVYILNQENLTGLDLGEEFWSETGEESITKTTLTFVAPESGKWFLVVENPDNKEVSATVNIKKSLARTNQKRD